MVTDALMSVGVGMPGVVVFNRGEEEVAEGGTHKCKLML